MKALISTSRLVPFPPVPLPTRAVSFHQEQEMHVCKAELLLAQFRLWEGWVFLFSLADVLEE